MIFRRPNGAHLKLDERALNQLKLHAQTTSAAPESGGVLLGRHLRDAADVVVDAISAPVSKDRRARTWFRRSRAPHQKVIDEAWAASGGTCVYLGEWHTHPEPDPEPSHVDKTDWLRHLRDDVVDAPSLFFLIVGLDRLRVWEGSRAGRRLVECEWRLRPSASSELAPRRQQRQ